MRRESRRISRHRKSGRSARFYSGLKAEDFDNIPYLALKGDYTPTSEVCQNTVDAINARRTAGQGVAKAEYIKLGELGNPIFKGTTHR